MTAVRFLPAARDEFFAAIFYYEERQQGLGARLNAEVEHAVATIIEHPSIGATLSPNVRRILLNRFPYSVIYRATAAEILIIHDCPVLGECERQLSPASPA